jgi:hypothetical protein
MHGFFDSEISELEPMTFWFSTCLEHAPRSPFQTCKVYLRPSGYEPDRSIVRRKSESAGLLCPDGLRPAGGHSIAWDETNLRIQAKIGQKIGHRIGQTGWNYMIFPCIIRWLRHIMIGHNALGDTLSDRACAA